MASETDVTTNEQKLAQDKAAEAHYKATGITAPTSEFDKYAKMAKNTMKQAADAINTSQHVMQLMEQSASAVENIAQTAYDIANELVGAMEDPLNVSSDYNQLGDSMPTSKSDPQKECGTFQLVSGAIGSIKEYTSKGTIGLKAQASIPVEMNRDTILGVANSGILSAITDTEKIVDDIVKLVSNIVNELNKRSIVTYDSNDPNKEESLDSFIDSVKRYVEEASSNVSSVFSSLTNGNIYSKNEWMSGVSNLVEAKKELERHKGNLEGTSVSSYQISIIKVIDMVNYLKDKFCLLERSNMAINTIAVNMQTISESTVSVGVSANTVSVVDRVNCHIDNILKTLEKIRKMGTTQANMNAYEVLTHLDGLIIFMTNAADLLKGFQIDEKDLMYVKPGNKDSIDSLINNEKTFKAYITDFITEALSLVVNRKKSTNRLKMIQSLINTYAIEVLKYRDTFGNMIDVDIDTDETSKNEYVNNATNTGLEIGQHLVATFNDPQVMNDLLNGNWTDLAARIGYDMLAQRFSYMANILDVTKAVQKRKLNDMAEERKKNSLAKNINKYYTDKTFDLSISKDAAERKQKTFEQYKWYQWALQQIDMMNTGLKKVNEQLAAAKQQTNDYKSKATKYLTNVAPNGYEKICKRYL